MHYVYIPPVDYSDDDDCGRSPTNLVFTRTHAELKQRKPRPVKEGLCLREKLYTKDYSCWE